MNRRVAVLALAVVVVVGSVAALVADPLAPEPEPSTVDATAESPDEFVLAALGTPERRSFRMRRVVNDPLDEGQHVLRVRVDRAHRRMSITEHHTGWETKWRQYTDECHSVTRDGADVGFRSYRYEQFDGPFHPSSVDPSELNATVVERTDGRVVLRVANATTALSLLMDGTYPHREAREDDLRGNLTVTWDADEEVLERVEYVSSSRYNETHRSVNHRVWEFQEWGHVHVERPGWAGYTHHEFLCDVTTFRT